MLLILDLDETLLHAVESPFAWSADFCVGPFHIYLRPHLATFLAFASQHFELAVWTSASIRYGQEVCKHLFPCEGQLEFVWCSDRCVRCYDPEDQESFWVKDFKKLRKQGYDLSQILMLDDTPRKHLRNYGNLVRISPYHGVEGDDKELLWLCDYLPTLIEAPNVRAVEKRGWQLAFKESRRQR